MSDGCPTGEDDEERVQDKRHKAMRPTSETASALPAAGVGAMATDMGGIEPGQDGWNM